MLNGEEMQEIVDELFIGNKLAAGMIRGSDGTTIDLRNIRSPIVVFCSKGDNITPRSRRSIGFSIFTRMWTIYARTDRRSSTLFMRK